MSEDKNKDKVVIDCPLCAPNPCIGGAHRNAMIEDGVIVPKSSFAYSPESELRGQDGLVDYCICRGLPPKPCCPVCNPISEMDGLIDRLREAAEGATPGKWHDLSTESVVRVGLLGEGYNFIARFYMWSHRGALKARANAAYCAEASPENILTILAELQRLRDKLKS